MNQPQTYCGDSFYTTLKIGATNLDLFIQDFYYRDVIFSCEFAFPTTTVKTPIHSIQMTPMLSSGVELH